MLFKFTLNDTPAFPGFFADVLYSTICCAKIFMTRENVFPVTLQERLRVIDSIQRRGVRYVGQFYICSVENFRPCDRVSSCSSDSWKICRRLACHVNFIADFSFLFHRRNSIHTLSL